MKSPKDMRIIQIDVTNACIHQCSNCTRFCGHHRKPFFMDFDTFRRAVDSLDGYVGTVGIMGGEPTLHPEFQRLVEYIGKKRSTKTENHFVRPQPHFMDAVHDMELSYTVPHDSGGGVRQTLHGAGLWSAIGQGYKKHYEIIQDYIQYQALNDHSNPMYHQPALIARKDLGIGDEEWIALRDACWIQNLWSATVTPKGAFFCEIAGALDMLFDGPGGWPIEQGWWRRTPDEFGDQLRWCELCGIACHTFTRNANEEVDDVSPSMYERLKKMGSPKVKTHHVNVVDIVDGSITPESKAAGRRFDGSMPYAESYDVRFDEASTNLTRKELVGIFALPPDFSVDRVMENMKNFDRCIILSQEPVEPKAKEKLSTRGNVAFRFGATLGHVLYEALHDAGEDVFFVVLEGECTFQKEFFRNVRSWVLNPGTLHVYEGQGNPYFQGEAPFSVAMVNGMAASIRRMGWDRILGMKCLEELKQAWQPKKVLGLAPGMEWKVPASKIAPGKRYAVYGAGQGCLPVLERIETNGGRAVLLVDSDKRKHGAQVGGLRVSPRDSLFEGDAGYDAVAISTSMYYREAKQWLMDRGIPVERLVLP